MIRENIPEIRVDIDKDRIREIVIEAIRMTHEYVGGKFLISQEQILEQLDRILNSNRISTQFFLSVGSTRIPDLELRVDPVRKEILGKSVFRKKVANLNKFLRIL